MISSTLSNNIIVLSALWLTTLLLNVVQVNAENFIPLQERWSISRPYDQHVVFDQNFAAFTTLLTYDISSFIQDDSHIQVQAVPGKECQFDKKDKNAQSFLSVSVSLELEYAPVRERSNGVDVRVTGTEPEFCIRFGLHDDKKQLVNWLDAQVTVHVTEDEKDQARRAQVDLFYTNMSDQAAEVEVQPILQE